MPVILLSVDETMVSAEEKETITTLLPQYELLITREQATIGKRLAEIEICAGWLPVELLLQAPGLKWMQTWSAGTDWLYRYPESRRRDFLLTNGSGIHAVPISEHILSFMLGFARRFPRAYRACQEKTWDYPEKGLTDELCGKTVVIVGMGAIGARTARLCAALEMEVIGIRRNPGQNDPHAAEIHGSDQLHKVLPRADYIIVTLPLTHETRGMLDDQAFNQMKTSAFIVNIGRGAVIDEAAMTRALREGRIAGAGLDTFETEPLPVESPLWDMENVQITCHYSGTNPSYHRRAMDIFLENMKRYTTGRPLRNLVDTARGY